MNRETLQRAENAATVLQNPEFMRAFSDVDAAIVAAWRATQDERERERLFYRQQALAEVKAELLRSIDAAATADARSGNKAGMWRMLWEKLK